MNGAGTLTAQQVLDLFADTPAAPTGYRHIADYGGAVETIHAWARHGMPANDSTREYAVRLLVSAVWQIAELQEAVPRGAQEAMDLGA